MTLFGDGLFGDKSAYNTWYFWWVHFSLTFKKSFGFSYRVYISKRPLQCSLGSCSKTVSFVQSFCDHRRRSILARPKLTGSNMDVLTGAYCAKCPRNLWIFILQKAFNLVDENRKRFFSNATLTTRCRKWFLGGLDVTAQNGVSHLDGQSLKCQILYLLCMSFVIEASCPKSRLCLTINASVSFFKITKTLANFNKFCYHLCTNKRLNRTKFEVINMCSLQFPCDQSTELLDITHWYSQRGSGKETHFLHDVLWLRVSEITFSYSLNIQLYHLTKQWNNRPGLLHQVGSQKWT